MTGLVYRITNRKNGHLYIGKTIRKLRYRWSQHVTNSLKGSSRLPLHKAIRKYSEEGFRLEVLHITDDQDELNFLEITEIHTHRSYGKVYNLTDGGDGTSCPKSELHKKKIGDAHRGKPKPECQRLALSRSRKKLFESSTPNEYMRLCNHNQGRTFAPPSEETRNKIRASKLGKKRKPFSEEWKANIAKARKAACA